MFDVSQTPLYPESTTKSEMLERRVSTHGVQVGWRTGRHVPLILGTSLASRTLAGPPQAANVHRHDFPGGLRETNLPALAF